MCRDPVEQRRALNRGNLPPNPSIAGQSNAAAIRAALLAEQGFTASPHSLDGKAGYTTLYSRGEDISPVLETLGTLPLEIDSSGIEVKKYPACYGIHRPLDALFDIMAEHRFGLADIERIEIGTSYEYARAVGSPSAA